jgi:hypothetical protein
LNPGWKDAVLQKTKTKPKKHISLKTKQNKTKIPKSGFNEEN